MADKQNRGFLGKNKFKKNENQPDYTGKLNVRGEEFKIAGWIRDSKHGDGKYMSLSVSEVEGGQENQDHESPF